MKKFLIIVCGLSLFMACSSGIGDMDEEVNRPPRKVGTLMYPTHNLLCISNVLDFEWSVATDPDGDQLSYILEIARDNGFTNIEHQFTVSSNTKTVTLDKGKAYYWRVQAKDSENATSNYSVVNQFYTEGEGKVNYLPFLPELLTPRMDSSVSGVSTLLQWNATDVDGDNLTYDVYFDADVQLNSKVGDNINVKSLSVDLIPGTTYYWKVVVKDGKGGQTIGPIWSFMAM